MNDEFSRLVSDHLLQEDVREQRWIMVRDIVIGLVCLVALLVAATYPTKAHAVQLDGQGCLALAVWSHDIALMRDLGADKEKLRAYFLKNKDEHPLYLILLRKFDELWATTLELEQIAPPVYQDCIRRRGQYGSDV